MEYVAVVCPGGLPAAPAKGLLCFCTLWVGAGCQMGWAYFRVKVPNKWEQGPAAGVAAKIAALFSRDLQRIL